MTLISDFFSWITKLPPLVYASIGLATVLYLRMRKRLPGNLPPFAVRPYPLLGHVPMLQKRILDIFQEWREKVGDIFSFKIGSHTIVVINNFELLKEAFVKKGDCFSDRPPTILSDRELKRGGLKGIIMNNGSPWKEQRGVSMQILRDFGMGKNWLAEKITEEVAICLDTMSKFKGEPSNMKLLINAAVSNVICAILVGKRFELDDPDFVDLLIRLSEQVTTAVTTNPVHAFPILQHLPGDFFGAKKLLRNQDVINDLFSAKFLKEAKENNAMNNFIGSYFDEMNKKKQMGVQTYLDEKNLLWVISNLFFAGSETTTTTLIWVLMFAIHHPEAQEKFYQEIVEIVGTERRPNMIDKMKMQYANAFVMETQRLASIAPLNVPHACNKTTEVGGYTIPAGTPVIANLDAILKEDETWGDPLVFRPERFLDADNKVIVPDQFIPFSIGRRYCMGEALAKMELFLFTTCIIQRFHILPEDPDNLPSPEPIVGQSSVPAPFKVRLVERESERAT